MEFDEMKKIWDTQHNRPLFVIDEAALHNRIRSKRNRAERTASTTEWLLIVTNLTASVFIVGAQWSNERFNLFIHVVAAWFVFTSILVVIVRVRRRRVAIQFDRTILGDLQHAIANASSQVRISQLMRWNVLPVAVFCVLAMITHGTQWWLTILIAVLFGAMFFASGWEHGIYVRRKKELVNLEKKLTDEPS